MSAPFTANTTCDVYRAANSPPAAPDVAGVSCFLRPAFPAGFEAAEGDTAFQYSHIMDVPLDTDVRDSAVQFGPTNADKVFVPDQDGTEFQVVGVLRTSYGTGNDRRRIFLYRKTVSYPTSYL